MQASLAISTTSLTLMEEVCRYINTVPINTKRKRQTVDHLFGFDFIPASKQFVFKNQRLEQQQRGQPAPEIEGGTIPTALRSSFSFCVRRNVKNAWSFLWIKAVPMMSWRALPQSR